MVPVVVLLVLVVIGSWILGVVGFLRAGRALRRLEEIGDVRREIDALRSLLAVLQQPSRTRDSAVTTAQEPARASWSYMAPAIAEPQASPIELNLPVVEHEAAVRDPTSAAPAPEAEPERPVTAAMPQAPRDTRLEAAFALRWGVWLGAIALLLAGVFLIRYAIDQGLLGPTERCSLAALLGVTLVAAAEWLRRTPRAIASPWGLASDQTLPALAGAGVAVLFAAAYGAAVFYSLVPPLWGFAAMAAAALAGLGVSLRYGQLPAAIGVAGAFATPMLIETTSPSLPGLFAYLLAVTAAALAVMRYSAWTWLGWAAAGAGAFWVVAAAAQLAPGAATLDGWAAGLFVAAAAGLNLALLPAQALDTTVGRRLSWIPFAALGVAGLLLEASAQGMGPRTGVMLLAPIAVWKGIAEPRLDRLPWLSAALSVAVLLLWALPEWTPTPGVNGIEDVIQAVQPGSWAPDVIRPLLLCAFAMAVFHAGAGLVMERRAPRPLRWSALTATVPLVTLAVTYAQVMRLQGDAVWAFVALALTAGLTVTAGVALREGDRRRAAVHGAGAVGALALGLAMLLHAHWLTMALSLMLPPLAWIEAECDLPALRRVMMAVAAVVLLRLVPNWYVLDYDFGDTPLFNGLLAAYGIPAAAFAWTAIALRRRAEDATVGVLEAGSMALATLLVTLEIRHWATGGDLHGAATFLEWGLQVSALAAGATAALWRSSRRPPTASSWLTGQTGLGLFDWTWRIQGGLALLGGAGLLILSPLFTNDAATSVSLGLAYLVPALLVVSALRLAGLPSGPLPVLIGGYALLAGLVWTVAEIRVLFHGSAIGLDRVPFDDSELWATSGAWLAYSALLLAGSILERRDRLRMAALGIMALTALKVFVVDMADLAGLWRVLSFLGLGISLITLGAVYRRFVLPPTPLAANRLRGERGPNTS